MVIFVYVRLLVCNVIIFFLFFEMKGESISLYREDIELINVRVFGVYDSKTRFKKILIFIYLVFFFRFSNVIIIRVIVSLGFVGNILKTLWRFRK